MEAYITAISSFLPNDPVSNSEMEKILGMINKVPSRTRRIILRNNKIKQRYYAIDPTTLLQTHTNAEITAEAIRNLQPDDNFSLEQIECLCCGTSSPDQLMPGHASMVHGELANGPCEVVSTAGICACGVSALKNACMQVATRLSNNAVATGSELASTYMRASFCGQVSKQHCDDILTKPELSFESDFLRWMLSDGAGAAFISPKPARDGISLKVEWIDQISSAHELPTCMYAGAIKDNSGNIQGWRSLPSLFDAIDQHAFLIKQDVKLLNEEVVPTAVNRALIPISKKRQLKPDEVTWFVPHYSSDYFREPMFQRMKDSGFHIPYHRWFSNLENKGNTGSASIYIMLDELFHSGKLKRGDKILCFVPESGRFTMYYMLLSVV
ncbi:MAG: hypothetical protein B6I36_07165 [Desulfobacteraceae bacterium 4572_35.1]|nr:MAG: hypothetical protein B6I36_07165 [Desulfobacteraceae bacterium 4572_35.1]